MNSFSEKFNIVERLSVLMAGASEGDDLTLIETIRSAMYDYGNGLKNVVATVEQFASAISRHKSNMYVYEFLKGYNEFMAENRYLYIAERLKESLISESIINHSDAIGQISNIIANASTDSEIKEGMEYGLRSFSLIPNIKSTLNYISNVDIDGDGISEGNTMVQADVYAIVYPISEASDIVVLDGVAYECSRIGQGIQPAGHIPSSISNAALALANAKLSEGKATFVFGTHTDLKEVSLVSEGNGVSLYHKGAKLDTSKGVFTALVYSGIAGVGNTNEASIIDAASKHIANMKVLENAKRISDTQNPEMSAVAITSGGRYYVHTCDFKSGTRLIKECNSQEEASEYMFSIFGNKKAKAFGEDTFASESFQSERENYLEYCERKKIADFISEYKGKFAEAKKRGIVAESKRTAFESAYEVLECECMSNAKAIAGFYKQAGVSEGSSEDMSMYDAGYTKAMLIDDYKEFKEKDTFWVTAAEFLKAKATDSVSATPCKGKDEKEVEIPKSLLASIEDNRMSVNQ